MALTSISVNTDVAAAFHAMRRELSFKMGQKITNNDLLRHSLKLTREDIDRQEAAQAGIKTEVTSNDL
jgi:hypothetical protein